jgi:hypothetical protein
MGKWQGEELLKLYTYVYFNFDFIVFKRSRNEFGIEPTPSKKHSSDVNRFFPLKKIDLIFSFLLFLTFLIFFGFLNLTLLDFS